MVYTSFVQVIKTKDGKIIKRSYTKLICFKKNMKQEEICVRNLPENIFYTIREKKLK
jgi:hypothetical protein